MANGVPEQLEEVAFARHADWHLATTPPIRDRAEYRHYVQQLREMNARIVPASDLSAIAMAWAVMERLKELEQRVR